MDSIDERLNRIEGIIKKDSFCRNKGLGNEVGYYIFDYDPQHELKVRQHVEYLKNKINNNLNSSLKSFEFEIKKGREFTKKAVNNLLKLSSESNLIVNHVKENTPENSVVFITGVGKSYPLLRSHNVLNNLHQVLDEVPVVMFFPGEYSGNDLVLFGTIRDNNYYRAFPLVE